LAPQPCGTLRVCPGLYRDCCTVFPIGLKTTAITVAVIVY
jgi:hypothetical protein